MNLRFWSNVMVAASFFRAAIFQDPLGMTFFMVVATYLRLLATDRGEP